MAQPTKDDINNLTNAIKNLTASLKKNGGGGNGLSGTGGKTTGGGGYGNEKLAKLGNVLGRSKNAKVRKAGTALRGASMTASKLKGGPWGVVLEAIGAAAKKAVEIYNKVADYELKLEVIDKKRQMASMNYQKDVALKSIDLQKQIASSFQDVRFSALTDAFSNSIMAFTEGINQSAYAQLRSQRASAVSLKKANINKQIAENTYTQEIKEMTANYNAEVANLNAEERQAKTEFRSYIIESVGGAVGTIVPGVSSLTEAWSEGAKSAAQRDVERTAINQELIKTEAQLSQVTTQASNATLELSVAQIEAADRILQATEALSQSIEGLVLKTEKASNRMGIEYGYSGEQLNIFKKGMLSTNMTLAAYGKTLEDALKWQSSYIENSSRAVNFSDSDFESMAGIDYLFNEDGLSARLTAGMNIFNTSVQSGNDMLLEMYNQANKLGVSNRNFAKDLEKSLKLAQRYTFKGGVDGVAKMALWAQRVRFNMDELGNMLEKMHTGNVEDVLTTSARLNVLGGAASVLSDPMSMLYNAYMDPAAYAKTMNQMIQGFGTFNKKTGETTFNMVEQMRMEAIAAATGQSKEELMNQARQANKTKALNKIFGNRYSKEDRTLIDSKATYNKEKGIWEVGIWDAVQGKYVNHDASDLNPNQIESLRVAANDKDLPQYVKDIRDWALKLDAERVIGNNALMNGTYDTIVNEFGERVESFKKNNINSLTDYIDGVKATSKAATDAYRKGYDIAEAARIELKKTTDDVSSSAANLASELDNAAQIIANAMGVLTGFQATGKDINRLTDKDKISKRTDEWEEAIDLAQNADLTNGKGQYINDDFIKNGYGFFDENGNFYLDLSKTTGFEDGDDAYAMAREVEKGGYRVNYNTGQVTRANDFIARPNGVIETHPKDTIVGFTNGEVITNNDKPNKVDNINLTVNGTLTLSSGNQKIDLMELVRNDPNSLRRLTEQILLEASRNKYGGRNEYNANRYTIS